MERPQVLDTGWIFFPTPVDQSHATRHPEPVYMGKLLNCCPSAVQRTTTKRPHPQLLGCTIGIDGQLSYAVEAEMDL